MTDKPLHVNRREPLGFGAALGVTATASSELSAAGSDDLFLIGLEEHYATPELMELNGIKFAKGYPRFNINDVGTGRIAHMDEAGLNIQVLSSLTPGAQNMPGPEGVEYARKLNSWIADEVIPAYSDRYRAFATLPLSEPKAAADELERAVREDGFLGCMTYGDINGKSLTTPTSSRC